MDNTISELRQAGQLAKAYEVAKKQVAENPQNLPNKISMAWVLHDYLKTHSSDARCLNAIKVLKEIRKLGVMENADPLYDQIGFWTATLLLNQAKANPNENESIEQIFQSIEDFPFPKPSKQYTWLLTGFLAHWENWSGFIGFMNWWGWENFRDEDFLAVTKNNRQFISVVEKLIGRYTKTILHKASGNELPAQVLLNLSQTLLDFMDKHHTKCKNYSFYTYYRAKVLHLIGEKEKAKDCFLPFAKKRTRDFWVWELLSQLENDPELALAYQVRAVNVKTKPEFLVKVREDLINKVIPINPNWAKTELDLIIKLREKKGWPLTNTIKEKMAEKWYIEGQTISTTKLYLHYSQIANRQFAGNVIIPQILINGHSTKSGKAFGLNRNKQTIKIVTTGIKLEIGKVYKISGHQGPNGWIIASQAKQISEDDFKDCIISKTDKFSLHPGKQFGFVKDVFIPPPLLKKYSLEDGVEVSVKAVQSFDRKKEKWAWQGFSIDLIKN